MEERYESILQRFDTSKLRLCYEDRVLVQRLPLIDHEGSIVIPESARNERGLQRGLVLAVGPGISGNSKIKMGVRGEENHVRSFKGGSRAPMSCKPGDVVLYERDQTHQFEQDGEVYTFLFEEQFIAAVLES